jgi:hypothetical protein
MDVSLAQSIKENRLAPLHSNKDVKTSMAAANPGSRSKNQRGSVSSNPESYRLLFAKIEVEFVVEETGARVVAIHPAPPEQTNGHSRDFTDPVSG